MGKKESPKKEDNSQPKIPGLSAKAFGVIKFILGICLLPFVYSSTLAFLNELGVIEKPLQDYFWGGLITLIIIYLFIWEPVLIYTRGQRLLEIIFSFFKPLVKVAPYLLPIYTIVLFILYGLLSMTVKSSTGDLINIFIFLLGLSIGLHLVFSAKSLRSRQEDFLKANYIFGFSFVYIINLILLSFGFTLIFSKFSFVNFCNVSYQTARSIFSTVFQQIFVNR